ncbi:hypothetical protein KSS87_003271 [Heliosperma pusillum]|nr:hypothetical protein KSS87_003271 [Heliosperma pusillum]
MIVTVIGESKYLSKLTAVTELVGSLHAHDQKFKIQESSSDDATRNLEDKKVKQKVTLALEHLQGDVDTINNDLLTPPLTPNVHSPTSNEYSKNATGALGKKNPSAKCHVTNLNKEEYKRCYPVIEEPRNYDEASRHKEWQDAMKTEINMINKNNTWELVAKPKDQKGINVKWFYKTKLNPGCSFNWYKLRSTIKRYSQQTEIIYGDTFSLIARHDTKLRRRFTLRNYHILLYKRRKKRKRNPQVQDWRYTKSLKEEC